MKYIVLECVYNACICLIEYNGTDMLLRPYTVNCQNPSIQYVYCLRVYICTLFLCNATREITLCLEVNIEVKVIFLALKRG